MAEWVGPLTNTSTVRRYTPGRNRPVQYAVIHTTEGHEGFTSAEGGVAYDKRRTDGTSTHIFVDADTALQEVRYADRAHAARFHGNEIGIQIELCGTAHQSAAQWADPISRATLSIAAREVAAICREFGLPVRRLSVEQVRAAYYAQAAQRPKGICGHIDVTRAYPEDGGSHFDPGTNFPWDGFLAAVAAELDGGSTEDMTKLYKADKPGTGDEWWLSNGIYRRGPLRTKAPFFAQAIAVTGESHEAAMILTDADRAAGSYPTWDAYLDAVCGPVAPTGVATGAHKHGVGMATTITGETGPPIPTG